MNRQSRRHPSSPYLPAFYPSNKTVVTANKKRKNTSVNTTTQNKKQRIS